MTEAVILGIITVLGGGFGTWVATYLREKNENSRKTTEVGGDVKKAELESDASFMDRLIKRVEHLEAGQKETDEKLRKADNEIGDLKLMVERVGNQYETNRKLQGRVARRLREGKDIDDETLWEMENAPEFSRVLEGIAAPRPLPPGE